MKRIIFPALVAALIAAGWAGRAEAQEVTVEPQPEASVMADGGVVYDGTVYDGGVVYEGVASEGMYLGDTTGQHAERSAIHGLPHMAKEAALGIHPSPVYAHSRRGAEATWTHQWNQQQAMMRPWHGNYYHYQYGAPLALIVPPTASFQSNYSWGVGRTTSSPIYHQFGRAYPGPASGEAHGLYPRPYWPSNTNQFGVYYIRGPW